MNESIYRKLADYLDRLTGGLGPSETGAPAGACQRGHSGRLRRSWGHI